MTEELTEIVDLCLILKEKIATLDKSIEEKELKLKELEEELRKHELSNESL